jgi:prepilin-type N-terminal cleavage/methylation domain-containing protein
MRRKESAAFSLVELMIVVAIIGIIATLAIPRFQNFQSKARQSEARFNLSNIYTLQVSYNGDNDTYSNFGCLTSGGGGHFTCTERSSSPWSSWDGCNTTNDIGFRVTDCRKVRYTYSTAGSQSRFTATASEMDANTPTSRRVFPGCTATYDVWQIDDKKSLYNQDLPTPLQTCNE